jgi:hypothetical protein
MNQLLNDAALALMVSVLRRRLGRGPGQGRPQQPFLYTLSCMHCMTVFLAPGGMGLGAMWGGQRAVQMLGEAGFASVEVKHVDGDAVNTYYICRREPDAPGQPG